MKQDSAAAGNSESQSNGSAQSVTSAPSAEVQKISQNVTPQVAAVSTAKNPTKDNAPNPAKRLEELNDLFKKGLITQKDYDSKKAEILKSL
jgi:NaMN:DMB phosphoribosyltransferase